MRYNPRYRKTQARFSASERLDMITKSVIVHYSVALLLCAAISVTPSLAQTSMGRISGTVTDSTNASISDAKVTVINVDTRATRIAASHANSFYTVTNLAIGNYTVQLSKQGFKTQAHTGISLSAAARITVDFKLEATSLQQTAAVTAFQTSHV